MSRESPQPGDATIAYIALGSNLGDRDATFRSAIAALRHLVYRRCFIVLRNCARWHHRAARVSECRGLAANDPSAAGLMAALLLVEQQHGRDRSASVPKGPRTLDLDLLSYGDVVMETLTLTLPHPSLAERRFVLVPLAEIAPQWRHPISGKTAADLLAEITPLGTESDQTMRKYDSSTASA